MKLEKVTQVTVHYEPHEVRRVRVGRLALKSRTLLFEYDPAFLAEGLEISPFKLPLARGVIEGRPDLLEGLMGVFDDSLPDGWGRLLIDRRAAELGFSASSLSPLDRLSLVGARGMGALVYEPAIAIEEPAIVKLSTLAKEVTAVQLDAGGADLERLIAVGGSPQGARPKVLIQIARDGTIHFGATSIDAGATAWLVKFRATIDDPGCAALEHAYAAMARAAGIDVPRTQLLGKTKQRPGYFAIERFDREGTTKLHAHTLGGLLHLPHGYPALDYVDALKVTRQLTRNEAAVEQTSAHLTKLAEAVDLRRAGKIVDEVRSAVDDFEAFAEDAGVPARLRGKIAGAIGAPRRSAPSPPKKRRAPSPRKKRRAQHKSTKA